MSMLNMSHSALYLFVLSFVLTCVCAYVASEDQPLGNQKYNHTEAYTFNVKIITIFRYAGFSFLRFSQTA